MRKIDRFLRSEIILVVALYILLAASVINAAPLYRITDLGDLPGGPDESRARGLNARGVVVGMARGEPSPLGETRRAFRWDRINGMVDLGFLPGFDVNFNRGSFAWDINNRGQIVGYSFGTPGGQFGFLWDPAIQEMTPLGDVPGVGPVHRGSAINNRGQVAGIAGGGLGTRASLTNIRTGSQENLGSLPGGTGVSGARDINRKGEVVGFAATTDPEHAFFWSPVSETMTDIGKLRIEDERSQAFGINHRGQVVGESSNSQSKRGFIWNSSNGIRDLGAPPTCDYSASAINNRGRVVGTLIGGGCIGNLGIGGFLWSKRKGFVNLNDLIDPDEPLFGVVVIEGAFDINDRGQIAADILFVDQQVIHAALLTPIRNRK